MGAEFACTQRNGLQTQKANKAAGEKTRWKNLLAGNSPKNEVEKLASGKQSLSAAVR
jgi:hypothetical protein